IVEERVDREVATERVFVGFSEDVVAPDQEIFLVVDVAFGRVAPERGDLDDLAVAEQHVGETEATAADPAVAEERADVVGTRVRRDVEVLGAALQEQVADAATDEVGLETGALEAADDLGGVRIDGLVVEGRIVTLEAGSGMPLENRGQFSWLSFDR